MFWALRRVLVRGSLGRMLQAARLRISLVLVLSVVFWGALYFLFYAGFSLLASMFPAVVESVFNAFFASLMVMLLFSSLVIMYSSLYRSPEAEFLLTTPARPERIFAYLFHESLWFTGWGFLLLGSPMLVATGTVIHAPWHYYVLLLPLMISFLYIPAALGAIICLLAVDRLGRFRWSAVRIAAVLLAAGLIWLGWSLLHGAKSDLMTPRWFKELSDRLRFTENRLLPSWWLSAGLIEAGKPFFNNGEDPPWTQSLMFLALLVANGLFLHQAAVLLAARFYRPSYSRLHTEQAVRRPSRSNRLDRLLLGRGNKPPGACRLLLVKELRLFRRDPVQWSQCLIFFGLLSLYFLNIRHFSYNPTYSAMIGFLNLAVVGLILSTFTTRFIYPMVSLDGRRLWILGLLPVRRDTILWTKFAFAAISALVPCCALMVLSDVMLDIGWQVLIVHQISCAMLCSGLAGIAVGLGAKMPELRETSPSKIAAGFGGTLTLVLSAVYIVVIVLLTAVPFHFRILAMQNISPVWAERWASLAGHPLTLVASVALTVAVGLVATIWPLRAGMREFRRLDI